MTPTHPPRPGTHRRIADLIRRGASDVPRIAAALAAYIDGYTDATATGAASKCNGCCIGSARRAAYAGADFEDGDDE